MSRLVEAKKLSAEWVFSEMGSWRDRRGIATAVVKFLLLALLGAGVAK